MKPITARAARLAFVLCALLGACACIWPQTAYAEGPYIAQPTNSNSLFDNGYCFTLLQESSGVTYGNTVGGKIYALEALPEENRTPDKGGIKNVWEGDVSPGRYSYTWPALVNNKINGEFSYIGGKGDAFAFITDADSANNGASGAGFTATWKKAAILRSTTDNDAPNGSLPNGGTYIDIKIDFKLVNTVHINNRFEKSVVQFHNRFDWGFWQLGISCMDQTITFIDSATGEELAIHGKVNVLGTSMDKGEGFALQGATGAAVSSTAPILNTHVDESSVNPAIPDLYRWSTVPGSYVYEINEDGWLGYLGAPRVRAKPDEIKYPESGPHATKNESEYIDNKYDSAFVFTKGGITYPSDIASSEDYPSAMTYAWRAASVEKTMNGESSLLVRQYAVGYSGWPKETVETGSGTDTGSIHSLGRASNNNTNPSLDAHMFDDIENGGNKFFTIAFSGLYGVHPGDPQKTVENHEAKGVGDMVNFTVSQPINTYGIDLFSAYESFSIYDTLCENLDYESAALYYVEPGSGNKTDVTNVAGTLTFDEQSNKVDYTFDKAYLQAAGVGENTDPLLAMVYQGGTYQLEIAAKVASDSQAELSNKAYSTINGSERSTAEVPVLVDTARLSLTKDVPFEHSVDDQATYTLLVENTEAGSVARNVVISDISLPASLRAVEGSAIVEGVPETVEVGFVKDGEIVRETVENTPSVFTHGNAIRVGIPYLPAGSVARVSFTVSCSEESNGKEIFNRASATFSNPAHEAPNTVEAADGLWVNTAKLSLLKHANAHEYQVGDTAQYTLSLANTTAGTIAKNVSISDSAMDERVKVDFSSVTVEGIPEQIEWPTDGNGEHASEERANAYTLEQAGNGFNLTIPYLPAGTLVTITYTGECMQDSNGSETMNTATATADNLPPEEQEIYSTDGIWTNDAKLVLSKTVDEYETQIGDTVHYTLEASNVASGTVAKDVSIDDTSLPSGFNLVEGSVVVEGAPDTIEYPIDGEGVHKTETRENSYSVEQVEGGFIAKIAYLPAGTPVKISYEAIPSEEVNGAEIVNTARISCANMLDGTGAETEASTWINSPQLAIEKSVAQESGPYAPGDTVTYRATINNLAVGTIARNIRIDDAFKTEGARLLSGSVAAFDTAGNAIDGISVSQQANTSEFSISTNASLVCGKDGYSRWHKQEQTVQEDLNPLGQQAHTGIVVEYQAVITSSVQAGSILENVATAQSDNADPVSDNETIPIKNAPAPEDNPVIQPVLEPATEPDPEPSEEPTSASQPTTQNTPDSNPVPSGNTEQAPTPKTPKSSDAPASSSTPTSNSNASPSSSNSSSSSSSSSTSSTNPSPTKTNKASSSSSATPYESVQKTMAKTGDYLQAHPFVAALIISGVFIALSAFMLTRRRAATRRRGRKA